MSIGSTSLQTRDLTDRPGTPIEWHDRRYVGHVVLFAILSLGVGGVATVVGVSGRAPPIPARAWPAGDRARARVA